MKGLLAIYRRELAGLFLGPQAWVILFLALLLSGLLFVEDLKSSGGDVDRASRTALVVLFHVGALSAPLLTMRMISEEARSGMLEFLLTAPVTDAAVVTGKFLAAASFLALLSATAFVYALALGSQGPAPDPGVVLGGWIGIALSSGLFCAVGMLASSLTSSPVVAAFGSLVANLALVLLPVLARLSDAPWVGSAAARVDVAGHLKGSFLLGAIDSAHAVFFVAWTSLLLFLAVRALEARRWR